MFRGRRNATVLWMWIGFCIGVVPAVSKSSTSKFDVSLVRDSNVFESVNAGQADAAGRLLFQATWKRRFFNSFQTGLSYRGGGEFSPRFSNESRAVNEWNAQGEIFLKPLGSAGFDLTERLKTFFRGQRGYSYTEGCFYFRRRLCSGLNATGFYSLSRMDYAGGKYFDCRSNWGGVRFHWAAARRMAWTFQGSTGNVRYTRQAFDILRRSLYSEEWIASGQIQKDSFREWSVQCESLCWLFLRLNVGYETSDSNNYGYAFRRPRIHLLAVKSVASDWTVGVVWSYLKKRYSDSLKPILQIRPESENEENNYVLADLTRVLSEKTSLRIQAGWYCNESPFRDLYYEKMLYSVGVNHAF